MKLKSGTKNRGLIYFFYDKQGMVDRYVTYMLAAMKVWVKDIYVVINGKLTNEGKERFGQFTENVWERENEGLDAWAYKYALEKIGWDKLEAYDELILMNHTIMGPVYPLEEMFETMNQKDIDFWGTNIFYKVDFDPFGLIDCGYIPDHLQSHFIVARRSLVSSEAYHDYWEKLPQITSYQESIAYHETYFTRHFAGLGYRWQAYAHWEGLEKITDYPMLKMPVELLHRTHCPFFKRRSFMHNHGDFMHSTAGEPSVRLMEFLEKETSYDVDMIWENILRCENMADIKRCLGLNYLASSEQSPDMSAVIQNHKVALVYHFYYKECLEDLLHYASSMPKEADIYITTGSEEKKQWLENAFQDFPNKIEVIIVENRGRDVSALLIGARDIVSRYEYICFAHDKKVAHVKPQTQGSGWSYKCFESLLKNRHQVNNIIKLFEDHPRLGLLTPAPPNHAIYYPTLGLEWAANYDGVMDLAKKMGLHVPISRDKEPIAPLGTIFWFRTKAMQFLFDIDWKYEDFPEEPAGNDGLISHAIERLYGFIPQEYGYYPAWIFSEETYSQELTNLTYMLRGYNRLLFSHGIGGGYFTETYANLKMALTSIDDQQNSFLTPSLYLDYGEGYSEKLVLRQENEASGEKIQVAFYWPELKGTPNSVRFDPCERGMIQLEDLSIYLIMSHGRKKRISLKICQCNGMVTRNIFQFKEADPWIDIPLQSRDNVVGIVISGQIKLMVTEVN